jgi:MFS family permease
LVYAAGLALTRLISGKIFDKHGPKLLTLAGMIFLITGLFVLSFIKNYNGFLTSALLIGAGFGIVFPTFQAMVNHIVDIKKRGVANSTFFTAVDLGIGLGAIISGFISDLFSLTVTFIICAIIIIIASIIFFVFTLPIYNQKVNALAIKQ